MKNKVLILVLVIHWILTSTLVVRANTDTKAKGLGKISPADISEIREFADLKHNKGNLLTPPRGAIAPEVKVARQFITELIEELAGPELKTRDIHFVVNIYGQRNINAWVQQMNPDDENSQEAKWDSEHKNEIWPLRQIWGYTADKKPIYEIAVTTTLLSSLKYVDEVAFIIGHELTHLFEGHTDHSHQNSEMFRQWWSSQAHEIVADHMGVDRILGKYEIDAALMVIEKLHPKTEKQMTLEQAIEAGLGTHHSEGVRVSALQYYIEYLRHFDRKAEIRAPKLIPDYLKLKPWGRNAKVEVRGIPEARAAYFDFLHKLILGEMNDIDIFLPQTTDVRIEFKETPMAGLFGDNEEVSFAELLKTSMQEINRSGLSKVDKINSFLKVMVFLGSRASSYYVTKANWMAGLTEQDRHEIARFLIANASGDDGWNRDHFRLLMTQLPMESRRFIEAPFMGNKFGQSLLSLMIKVSPQWQQVFNYWSSVDSYLVNDQLYALELGKAMNDLRDSEYPEGPLRDAFRANFLKSLQAFDDSKILMNRVTEMNIPEFLYLNLHYDEKTPKTERQWLQAIELALTPHQSAYQQKLFEQATKLFGSQHKTRKVEYAIDAILTQLNLESLSQEQAEVLQTAFEIQIKKVIEPIRNNDVPASIGAIRRGQLELVTQLMKKNQGDRAKLLNYLRYILVSFEPRYGFTQIKDTLDEVSPKGKAILSEVIDSLTREELWELMEAMTPVESEVRTEMATEIKKYNAYDFIDLISRARKTKGDDWKDYITRLETWEQAASLKPRLLPNLLMLIEMLATNESIPLNQFSLLDMKRLLSDIEMANYYNKFRLMGGSIFGYPQQASSVLFQIFLNQLRTKQFHDFAESLKTYERVRKIAGEGFTPTLDEESEIRGYFHEHVAKIPLDKQLTWLRRDALRKVLGADFVGKQLASIVIGASSSDRQKLKTGIEKILKMIPLKEKWPDAYQVFRNEIVEASNIQPQELKTILADDTRSLTKKAEMSNELIRGMSAFSSFARSLPPDQQIEMIEFIMGRTEKVPKKLSEMSTELSREKIDLQRLFFKIRDELKYRTLLERSMVVNSVLAGPNGLLADTHGLYLVKQHLLSAVGPMNQEVTSIVMDSLEKAEEKNLSLFFAYALSQFNSRQNGNLGGLTETLVFRSFLDAYGVPGVKLAQYLAFANEFEDFRDVLEKYQDAAMPINYYEALLLINERLGKSWNPLKYKVVKIIGSGSVNIAIELLNLETGKAEVVSIGRDDIEIKTKEDFRRFRLLLAELTRTPEKQKKFGFILGLMDIIQKSVSLEFEKDLSFKIQNQVQDIYRQEVAGWHIRSVKAHSVEGLALFMEKAPGISARKILKNDPETYKSAMTAFMRVEYGVLRGVNQTRNWNPLPLHANPDIHNGQILIEVETRTVTVLDFGQTVEISNRERELALDILRIISNMESVDSVIKIIQAHSLDLQKRQITIDREKLKKILVKNDRMDIFIHFLSLISQSGFEVPLSSVHWVLAANRLIKLGEIIDASPERSIAWLLGMRKTGLPLVFFNAGKDLKERLREGWRSPNRSLCQQSLQ